MGVDPTDVDRAHCFAAPTGSIRCELARSHTRLAGPLLHSFVHHHCVLADCDVATVDALDASVAEVVDTVADRLGVVTRIELSSYNRRVDVRLSIDAGHHSWPPAFRWGAAARAAPLWTSFETRRSAAAGAPVRERRRSVTSTVTSAMTSTARQPGVRLTLPALVEHATLVRACLRDAVSFRSDDDERSFLIAVTEIVVNAIEASAHGHVGPADRPDVVVELWGSPDPHVEVHDETGRLECGAEQPENFGIGTSIAAAFVPDLRVESDGDGTRVRLGLSGLTR